MLPRANGKPPACPICKTEIHNGETNCIDCGAQLYPTFTPPTSVDDFKPVPGPISRTYNEWFPNGKGKRVRIKQTQEVGTVFGIDPRPMQPPGLSSREEGYLVIRLDKPRLHTDKAVATPEEVDILE